MYKECEHFVPCVSAHPQVTSAVEDFNNQVDTDSMNATQHLSLVTPVIAQCTYEQVVTIPEIGFLHGLMNMDFTP